MQTDLTINDRLIGRNNNLDFIRFFASVLVLISHAYPLTSSEGEILLKFTKQMSLGNIAVAIFFVISGFLIMQSFERSKNFLTFVTARVLRIFPGLIVAIIFCAFIIGPLATTLPVKEYLSHPETYSYLKTIKLYPMHWLLPGVFENTSFNNSVNGSLWTIPFELLCYLLVAVIGILGLIKYKRFTLFLFVVSIYAKYYLKAYVPTDISWVYLPSFFDLLPYFAAGMLFYSYRDKISLNKWNALICALIIGLGIKFGGLDLLLTLFGSYLIFYFAYNKNIKLNNFGKYGDWSYGIYIYAFPVQQTVTHFMNGNVSVILNIFISLPITIVLAYLSWHLVEKRALRYKSIFVPKRSKVEVSTT